MKVLAFNGSPRAKNGVTDMILQQFMAGAREAGAETETIYLAKKKINYCTGCLSCWLVHPGTCIHKDDMAEILEKRTEADMLVHASPVYVDGFTAQMKTMLDRCITLGQPFVVERNGHSRHPGQERYRRKAKAKMVLVSTCGFGEVDNFEPIIFHMKAIARNMAGEYLGELIHPMGPALQMVQQIAPEKAKPILEAFYRGGFEAVSENAISEETKKAASRSIMSIGEFTAMVNKMAREMIEQNRAKEEARASRT
jgi:multimeric flavodoxin WrbA